jgi:Calx-beta domain/FG-GAP-like repeat/Domain of unknown function (DUF4214)/FG-GAP repeat
VKMPRRLILTTSSLLFIFFWLVSSYSPNATVGSAASSCSIPNFSGPVNISLADPKAMASGDFNHDGKLDLAVANTGAGGVLTILLGNGGGAFSQTSINNVLRGPSSIVTADLNGDGNLDLIVGNQDKTEGSVFVFLGNGAGGFGARKSFVSPFANLFVSALAVGDVNGDGKPDVVIATNGGGGPNFQGITVLPGDGAGNLTVSGSKSTGGFGPAAVLLKDLNGDSKLDAIVGNQIDPNSPGGNVAVLLGDGAGNFSPAVTTVLTGSPLSLAMGDFNGDGKSDLATPNSNNVSLLFGDGAGNFSAPTNINTPAVGSLSVNTSDFNGDGKLDLAVSNTRPGSVLMLLGDGAGGFNAVTNFGGGGPLIPGDNAPIVIGDFNGDANPDVAVLNVSNRLVAMLLNSCGTPVVNQIQLTRGSYSVDEEAPSTEASQMQNRLTVMRTGDINGTASVMAATSDNTAVAPQDYGQVSTTLSFAPGEIFKPISVSIVDDTTPESFESFNITLSGATGNATLANPSTAPVFIFDNDTSTIGFDSNADPATTEGAGSVSVQVLRTGNTNGTATLNYTTTDTAGSSNCDIFSGKASARCDYVTTAGTLTFMPGDTSKTITIPIVDDSYAEGLESFSLTLSNLTGPSVTFGRPTVGIAINDNETSNGLNPIDTASFFVRTHYLDFLNRQPDADGLTFWTNQITSCGTDTSCTEVKRINTSGAFFLSIEFQQTGYLVERLYKTAYGDATGNSTFVSSHQLPVPIVRLNEFLADTQQIGQGIVVLAPGWEQALETNKQNFVSAFVQRARFLTDYPANMSAVNYVDKLNTRAGNPLSSAERDQLVADLSGGGRTRAQVLRAIAEHPNLVNAEVNRAFVLMQYFGYLRRNPNDAPDSDHTGYDFWLTKLDQFHGDFLAAEMVKAFINSAEYRKRFGP